MNLEIINIKKPMEENDIFNHFQDMEQMSKLILMYQLSQVECSRSNKLTPDIGISRERDLIASFVNNSKIQAKYDISNLKEEDMMINGRKLSIKHSSNKTKTQNGLKITWTVDNEKRTQFLKNYCFTCDIVIVYVRFAEINNGEIEVLYPFRHH